MAAGVFVGLSTIDLLHTVDAFPSPNSKAVAHAQDLFVGGPATNAAIAFSHLGGKATLAAAVGRNQLAAIIKDDLQRNSIELIDLTPDTDELPAISSVWVDRHGRRSVVSVNTRNLATVPPGFSPELPADTRILQVDGHSMQACQAWARMARSRGIPVVLDGGSWKEGTDDLLESIDMAICSADFMPPGCTSHDQLIQYLQVHKVKHIAITRGGDPIRFVSGSSSGAIPVPQIEVVDTSGAGDILHGAFCFYAASGLDFVEALRQAALVASQSCRYPGTRRWMQAV